MSPAFTTPYLEQDQASAVEAESAAALVFASAQEGQRNAVTSLTKAQKASSEAAEAFSRSLEKSKLS